MFHTLSMALIRLCLPLANYYTEVYIVKLLKILIGLTSE